MDLNAAREVFETSQDLTVGIEEEWAIIDPVTLELVPKFEALRADADQRRRALRSRSRGELISSEIEIRSGRGEDVAARAVAPARGAPAAVRAGRRARRRGSPRRARTRCSDYRDQHIIDTEHYHRVQDGLQYVAHRNNTFALQVHVGVQGGDRAIQACDRLRPVLPMLLAISANSPFVDGRDSGLHSARTQTFTKSFPRCGVPDLVRLVGARGRTTWSCCCARTRSSSSRSCGGRCARTTPTGRSRCGSATRRPPAPRPTALVELIVACVAQALREIDAGEIAARRPRPADRGEHVAGAALRAGRPAARPRGAERSRSTRRRRPLDRLKAWTGVDVVAARAQRRPAPAAHDRRRRARRTKSSSSAWRRPARRTRQRRRSDMSAPRDSPRRSSPDRGRDGQAHASTTCCSRRS